MTFRSYSLITLILASACTSPEEPTLISSSPAQDEEGVAVDIEMVLRFSDRLVESPINRALRLSQPGGNEQVDIDFWVEEDEASGEHFLHILPDEPLAYDSFYSMTLYTGLYEQSDNDYWMERRFVTEAVPDIDPDTDPDSDTEAPPVFNDDVLKVMYSWTTRGTAGTSPNNTSSNLVAIPATNTQASPALIEQALAAQREIGGDCVAYVHDSFDTESRDITYHPTLLRFGGGDVGSITGRFLSDTGGVARTALLEYQTDSGRYSIHREYESYDGTPQSIPPTAGEMTIGSSGGPINGTTTHANTSVGLDWACGENQVTFSINGFSRTCAVPAETTGGYLNFSLDGPTLRADIYCAAAASGGNVTLDVPSLAALGTEVGWTGSLPASGFTGPSTLSDPYLVGPYGVVEQAVNGPVRLVEGRIDFLLLFR